MKGVSMKVVLQSYVTGVWVTSADFEQRPLIVPNLTSLTH
jgi:hypothetical protein